MHAANLHMLFGKQVPSALTEHYNASWTTTHYGLACALICQFNIAKHNVTSSNVAIDDGYQNDKSRQVPVSVPKEDIFIKIAQIGNQAPVSTILGVAEGSVAISVLTEMVTFLTSGLKLLTTVPSFWQRSSSLLEASNSSVLFNLI